MTQRKSKKTSTRKKTVSKLPNYETIKHLKKRFATGKKPVLDDDDYGNLRKILIYHYPKNETNRFFRNPRVLHTIIVILLALLVSLWYQAKGPKQTSSQSQWGRLRQSVESMQA